MAAHMKRSITKAVATKAVKASKAPKAKKLTKAEVIHSLLSAGYKGKTASQLMRLTLPVLTGMLAETKAQIITIDCRPQVEQDVDCSCAASVLATSALPVATHAEPLPVVLPVAVLAEPLPVARLAEPIVKRSWWNVVGQVAACLVAAPFVLASLPLLAGGAMACVLVAHVVEQI